MNNRELNFYKINEFWYYDDGEHVLSEQYKMPACTNAILDFVAQNKNQVTLRMLRKNTLERVKISLGRVRYMRGRALYYILDYTGAQFGIKEIGRKKVWIGSTTRKVLNNFPEVINLTW